MSDVAAQAPPQTEAKSSGQVGLPAAIALIMGSIIGVGVFNLPTSLAPYGPITLVSPALTTVRAVAPAALFAGRATTVPAPRRAPAGLAVRGDGAAAAGRRRPLRLRPRRVRQRRRLHERLVVLDHGVV